MVDNSDKMALFQDLAGSAIDSIKAAFKVPVRVMVVCYEDGNQQNALIIGDGTKEGTIAAIEYCSQLPAFERQVAAPVEPGQKEADGRG